MKSNAKPRSILPRTTSCYNEAQIIENAGSSIHSDVASEFNEERRSPGKNYSTPLANFSGMGHSIRGEARKRRSPSPCHCEVQRDFSNEGYGSIRFHLPEAWELSRVQISEGKCEVCSKERRLRDLKRISRRLFVGQEGFQDLWEDSGNANGWEEPRRDQQVRFRILPNEQEEDRGLQSLDCEEEMPTEEALDSIYLGEYDGNTYVDTEDNEVAQQESVSRETIRSERLVSPWEDDAWEDELNNLIGQIFPYVPPPSG